MLSVIINRNDPFSLDDYVLYETDDLCGLLQKEFPVWPEHARIYHNQVAEDCDVTPTDTRSIARLEQLEGTVYVVVYPGDPGTLAIIAIAVAVLSAAAFLFLSPKLPEMGSSPSSNNSLSERSNKARPNSRIPDIFGQVRSIPDLIAVPYRIFENNVEVEIAYMCVGRGSYLLEDIRDGDTYLSSISGAGATFYGPNTSPNYGTPQLQIGSSITEDLYSATKLNEVNGQTLKPPNANAVKGAGNIRFNTPNLIESIGIDFTKTFEDGQTLIVGNANYGGGYSYNTALEDARFYPDKTIEFDTFDPSSIFTVGQSLTISNAVFTDGTIVVDLSGTYIIATINSTTIELI
jgi:hypothetical protein